MKVYVVYGVEKLHGSFNKTRFNKKNYLVLLISNFIALFKNIL